MLYSLHRALWTYYVEITSLLNFASISQVACLLYERNVLFTEVEENDFVVNTDGQDCPEAIITAIVTAEDLGLTWRRMILFKCRCPLAANAVIRINGRLKPFELITVQTSILSSNFALVVNSMIRSVVQT